MKLIKFLKNNFDFSSFFNNSLGQEEIIEQGKAAQEESHKEYLKKSPEEKAICKRFGEIMFGGDYTCPHCKKNILKPCNNTSSTVN